MDHLPDSFRALIRYDQFIIYKLVPRNDVSGKNDKFPVNIDGIKIDSSDPKNWLSAQKALTLCKTLNSDHGVGFVFTKNDPFWFLDIDNALKKSGWSELATELVTDWFPDALIETSSSGKGLHIIGSGAVPAHSCRNILLNIEFYTENRFIALTGFHARGCASSDYTVKMPAFIGRFFEKKKLIET